MNKKTEREREKKNEKESKRNKYILIFPCV